MTLGTVASISPRIAPDYYGAITLHALTLVVRAVFASVGWPFIGLIIVGILMTVAIRQRGTVLPRSGSLRALAPRLGFDSFDPGPDEDFVAGWCFLGPLSRGDDRYASNIFKGTYHDEPVFIFDYHYVSGPDKKQDEHNLTILMLIVKQVFPKITIKVENMLSKIGGAFDEEDIKFESAEFSRVYCVRSADKKFAYDVCNPQMIDFLLANRGLNIEIQGPVISLAFPLLPAYEFESSLQQLAQIRALLPQYLFTNS